MDTKIILGVIGSDSHVVGITILDHALRDAGYKVINIGVQASQEDFITAAEQHEADAIMISSLYGHALQDTEQFHTKLDASNLDILTYIGGNLSVGQQSFSKTRTQFKARGFDRVFNQNSGPEDALEALAEDLGEQERQSTNRLQQ